MHLVDLHVPTSRRARIWTPDLRVPTATQTLCTAPQGQSPIITFIVITLTCSSLSLPQFPCISSVFVTSSHIWRLMIWEQEAQLSLTNSVMLVCTVVEVWQDFLSEDVDKKFTYICYRRLIRHEWIYYGSKNCVIYNSYKIIYNS